MNRDSMTQQELSRREFVRVCAVGTAGLAAGSLLASGAAKAAGAPLNADQNAAREGEGGRMSVDLSGDWEFKMDPLDVGKSGKWFDPATPYERKIQVPGAWNAQGVAYESEELLHAYEEEASANQKFLRGIHTVGTEVESEKLFSVYPGAAWYRKKVTIPAGWKGRLPWLVFGGIHREAEVWVNGKSAGEHHSYLTPLRIDLSEHAKAGEAISVVARVDGRRKKEIDPLMGCLDSLDFLYITWGGLYRGVTLEATAATRIKDVFVVPQLASGTAEIHVAIDGLEAGMPKVVVKILDADGKLVASVQGPVAKNPSETVVTAHIEEPRLWSPKSPYLYTARVQLLSGGQTIDALSTRFGMRELKVAGGKFLLNGKPIFLRGYGDDCIFPNTLCPPADKEELRHRLSVARDYGFNYVRCHSWIPPREYLDVADEIGMMVQPEFPFAYQWELPTTEAAKRFAIEEWEAVIRLNRNHPSIVAWCMGNEHYGSFDFAPEMYDTAKRLDPTRLVIDSDGCGFKAKDRKTLDFLVVQFDESKSIGFQDTKYPVPPEINKPVIAHEMGYFVTLHDLSEIPLFKTGLRPYWLFHTRDLVESKNLAESYPKWLAFSYRLQAASLKCNMEAARSSGLSGTSVWLFQDYPNCAEGVVDMFSRPKSLLAAEFRKFNSPTVLLLDAPRRNWWSGEKCDFKFLVSRFEDEPSESATLQWTLRSESNTVATGAQGPLQVSAGGVQALPTAKLEIPSLAEAQRFILEAELADANGKTQNSWNFWVFPKAVLDQSGGKIRSFEFDALHTLYPWALAQNTNPTTADTDLLVTTSLEQGAMDYLESGGRVILVNPEPLFTVEKTHFRLASWDGGGPSGTILDTNHPALHGMPSEGWCDLQFYLLIQESKTVLLSSLPAKIHPLVRCIDRPTRMEDRAYLFEVAVGRGKLLVSGFNFAKALELQDPAGTFLFDRLIRYAVGEEFAPKVSLCAPAKGSQTGWQAGS